MLKVKFYLGINNFLTPDYESFGLGYKDEIFVPNTSGSVSKKEQPKQKKLNPSKKFCTKR